MVDLKQSAGRAKEHLEGIDLPHLRDLHLDDIDWHLFQKREEEAASRGFLGGFLLGVLVGAVLALVFAPRRGDETREIVAGAAGDLRDKASDLVGHQARTNGTSDDLSSDGPAIEREIGDAAESVADPLAESRTNG